MRKVWPICILAVAWAVGPAIPALLASDLLGHGHTDLYPSVWGLWAFAEAQPGLPNRTDLLGFPQGMGYYYSSPIKGWLAALLLPIFSLPATWNLLVIAARLATVMTATVQLAPGGWDSEAHWPRPPSTAAAPSSMDTPSRASPRALMGGRSRSGSGRLGSVASGWPRFPSR